MIWNEGKSVCLEFLSLSIFIYSMNWAIYKPTVEYQANVPFYPVAIWWLANNAI